MTIRTFSQRPLAVLSMLAVVVAGSLAALPAIAADEAVLEPHVRAPHRGHAAFGVANEA